jgi:Protein of unknown function (DUF3375)
VERIRDIFNLAMSMRADFRRVEDPWRDTDRALRHSIVSEQNLRGEIVDKLLYSHYMSTLGPSNATFSARSINASPPSSTI